MFLVIRCYQEMFTIFKYEKLTHAVERREFIHRAHTFFSLHRACLASQMCLTENLRTKKFNTLGKNPQRQTLTNYAYIRTFTVHDKGTVERGYSRTRE